MEHRCGERLSLMLSATLRKAGGEALSATIRNLSASGAFVSLSDPRTILQGLVELELYLPGAEPRLCRWRALVTRRQPGGAGLMFDDQKLAERLPFLAAQRAMRRITGQMLGEGRVSRNALDL